jgi:hypothetical protein
MVLVVEHGSTRSGRWLRRNRTRLALWIAVAEGLLVLFDVIPGWTAFVVAVALIAFYAVVGRRLSSEALRQASWTAAVSQLLIALLPVLVAVLTFAAVVVVGILVVVALAFLFIDRR